MMNWDHLQDLTKEELIQRVIVGEENQQRWEKLYDDTKAKTTPSPDVAGLVGALKVTQFQVDEDGTNIGVSRQAVEEARDALLSLSAQNEESTKAAGWCEKHKPKGGARNCLVCACIKLTYALSRIDYALGPKNEMGLALYDTDYDEERVVQAVEQLSAQLKEKEAECAGLKEKVTALSDALDYLRGLTPEAYAALLKDAERYRWLREQQIDKAEVIVVNERALRINDWKNGLDSLIDSARKESK